MAYNDQNIFAKILRGEIPCVKVYEDDKTLAFMSWCAFSISSSSSTQWGCWSTPSVSRPPWSKPT